jgi:acetyl esterase/lipase
VIGSRKSIHPPILNDLVSLGFLAVSADYSLCPQVSLNEGPLHDARTVYAWCKKELSSLMLEYSVEVNASKIAAIGFSAGATLALHLVCVLRKPRYFTGHRNS